MCKSYLDRLVPIALVIALVALLTGCAAMGSMMIHEQQSPYDFDKTVATINENAKAAGWVIPTVYDFQDILIRDKKPDPGKIKVIKICKADIASELFTSDDSKFVSVVAPCSISVYEKTDGRTYVSTMNMALMSKLFTSKINQTLSRVAEDDERITEFLLK
jgi:uncharacterized protein (DUF302 family)